MDNLKIKGIESDAPRGGRSKPRGRIRKPFAIESRLYSPKGSVMRQLRVCGWSVWGRYRTQAARDQAHAALVKKEVNADDPRWSYWEFRKKSEGGGGGTAPC